MNEVSEAIARWLEQKRRTDRTSAAVISMLALGGGMVVFLLMEECHPDLFADMDQQSKALAERWTKALNAAYATLNPRHGGAKPSPTAQR